jgi:hypothetical protein
MTILRIVGVCLCAAGTFTVLAGVWIFKARMEKVRTWRPVEARVVMSEAKVTEGIDNSEAYARYEVSYEVGGKAYTRKFGSWSSSLSGAQTRVMKHPVGSVGTIYCNPADAGQVDANLGMNPATLSLPANVTGVGLAVIVFGLMFVLLGGGSGRAGDLW